MLDKRLYFQEYRRTHKQEVSENRKRCILKQQTDRNIKRMLNELLPQIKDRLTTSPWQDFITDYSQIDPTEPPSIIVGVFHIKWK